ncbi:MAG: hypothetical protein ACI9LV_000880 [Candidatus Nanohaloarchaea archaeon]
MTRYVLLKQDRKDVKPGEEEDSPDSENREMLVGDSFDAQEARDRWIDSVERILENESFDRKQKHARKNLHEVRFNGDYGLREPPRWMI